MESGKTCLERAFELAGSGKYHDVQEIVQRLRAEFYDANQIEGRVLRDQLRGIMKIALSEKPGAQSGGLVRAIAAKHGR